jgi:hypothetical protein
MPVSSRPVTGANIASLWGQEVHDQVFAPKGVQAHGATGVSVDTSYAGLPLDTADEDPGGWLVGGDIVEVPAGAGGLYIVNPKYAVSAGTTGQLVLGSIALNGPVVSAIGISCITSATNQGGFSEVFALSAGDQLSFQGRKAASGGADPTVQLIAMSIVRIGEEIGA